MMERYNNWISRLFNCFILCLIISFQSACSQEGFVSIQCCAETSFTDTSTNITWESDRDWFLDGSTCEDLSKPRPSDAAHSKVRIFSSPIGKKWCFNLTTVKNQDYLIRGTFPSRDLQGTFSFKVLIGITRIGTVKDSSNYTELEAFFRASDDYTNLCLENEKGDPYISQLELRPLTGSDYLKGASGSVLKLIERVDVGSDELEIRYSDDPYDRIWRKDFDLNQAAYRKSSLTAKITNTNIASPPIKVLQTAVSPPDRLQIIHHNLIAEVCNYELYLYFLELDESVQVGQRMFDLYINNERQLEIDVLAQESNYRRIFQNFTANGFLNLTLVKANGSLYGPIINAYEILQVIPWAQETFHGDVDMIVKVRNELLKDNRDNEVLKSWSGDPCLPLPWLGLQCKPFNDSVFITKLNLSFSELKGPLPSSINGLAHLNELNLSNNAFTQTIPEFSVSSMLRSVDLSHNNLTGKIPESLISLQSLKILYVRCNPLLSKESASSFRNSRLATEEGSCGGQQFSHSVKGIVIGAVTGGSLLVTVAVAILIVCLYRRKLTPVAKFKGKGYPMTMSVIFSIPSMDDIVMKSINIQNFTLQCLEVATENYKTLIGEGGFGSVYRGTLSDGQEVAVKVRSATSTQGTREFDNELNLLSAIQHENLVPLFGYCCENEQQILVYPFMSNGSLQDRLYGEAAKRKTLDWPTRLSIALGAARGLTYLHSFAGRCVIHRDVKSSNILLDQSMCAKVADFGFSKYAPQEEDSNASLEVRGTAGYLDPEYYSTQHLSAKSDVFSFGVVLLEIISGREPLDIHRPRNEWSLVEWAKPYIRNSRIDEIVDASIKGGYHAEAMWRVVEVALACTEPFSAYRPCMADIVRELEDALIIENNASEYMKSIDSFGGSHRFSIERPIPHPPAPSPVDASPILSQPPPPQPR